MSINPATWNNFVIYIGGTFSQIITWASADGYPNRLNGYSADMQIRYNLSDTNPAIELSTANGDIVLEALVGTATISIASPALITVANQLWNGAPVYFSTTGALPTGITAGQVYFAYNVTPTTFNISSTPVNCNNLPTPINTTGTQSGVQSVNMAGAISLNIANTVTETLNAGNAVYDLQLTDSSNNTAYLLQGMIALQEMVTR